MEFKHDRFGQMCQIALETEFCPIFVEVDIEVTLPDSFQLYGKNLVANGNDLQAW
jgi:hypothetical protein